MHASIYRENLKALATAYGKATGRTLSQISRDFYGNAGWLDAFLAGKKSISVDKVDEIISGITENWPAEAKWPALRAIVIRRPRAAGKTIPN